MRRRVGRIEREDFLAVGDTVSTVGAIHTGVFVGPGFTLDMGPRAATYLALLDDVNYEAAESPYGRPWLLRFGFGIGVGR